MSAEAIVIEGLKLLSPIAQAYLAEAVKNTAAHPDPEGAAQLAAMVTASRASAIATANAVLKLKRKARK